MAWKQRGMTPSFLIGIFALAGTLMAPPVFAGETNVILGEGDTATVKGGGTTVEINSNGQVIVHTDDKNVDIRPAAHDEAAADMQIGQMVAGKGVFVGTWAPKDQDGHSLGKTFNLFAAPEDMDMPATFKVAVRQVADLKHWHGHDGFNHLKKGVAPDTALYEAIRTGSYQGEWFIPPLDALQNHMYQNRHAFKSENAFVTTDSGSDLARWYWSCTEHPDDSSVVYLVDFTYGVDDWLHKGNYKLSTRPVRAEPAAP